MLWCGKVTVVKRSAMEKFTLARYFRLTWHRAHPLWSVGTKGECPFMVRGGDIPEAGCTEISRSVAKGGGTWVDSLHITSPTFLIV